MTVAAILAGCSAPTDHAANRRVAEPASARSDTDSILKEYWDAYYFGDDKVGYAHTTYATVQEDRRHLVKISAETELTVQRFGRPIKQSIDFSSWETPEGELVRFDSSMVSHSSEGDQQPLLTQGTVEGDRLVIRISSRGQVQSATMEWDKSWGGFFAIEQTLERTPLKPGEKRTVRAITPGINQVAEVEFEARDYETTEMLSGSQELLRIGTRLRVAGNTIEQITWTNRKGQTLKTYMPTLKQTTYRTTKDLALRKSTGGFDLGERTVVKVEQSLEDPHATQRIVYRVSLTNDDPAKVFAQGATQKIRSIDGNTAELHVRSLRPELPLGTEFPADVPPTDDDRLPNALIQSDDSEVVAIAQEVARGETDAWKVAVAMERQVRDYVSDKDFAQALGSAADVARSREGDCTEHAVLLAALLRARQIPARVAIGLVYFRPVGGFAYHMWTEAWIRERWVPLDATLGRGGIGAGHLKVTGTNLKGVDPFSQFLPFLQLMGNLRVSIISVR